jgi:hypothetical protein
MNAKLQEVNSKLQKLADEGCAFGNMPYEECKLLRSLLAQQVLLLSEYSEMVEIVGGMNVGIGPAFDQHNLNALSVLHSQIVS